MKSLIVSIAMLALALPLSAQSSDPISYTINSDSTVTLKNTSSQPIVAYMVQILGRYTTFIVAHDWFTKNHQFDPGKTMEGMVDSQSESGIVVPPGSGRNMNGKKWIVTVIWCQFTDGSQWGDTDRAKDYLADRQDTLNMLQTLSAADDATFAKIVAGSQSGNEVTKQSGRAITAYMLQRDIWSGGVAAARAEVATRLQNAAARRAVGSF